MRLEVHLHGYLELCEGVSKRQVETALRPLLEYLDVENLEEIESLEEDQPGFQYNKREFGLEICCTLEVGGSFFAALEGAMNGIGILLEEATALEVILYHADGRDESQLIFIGPSAAAIQDVQRRRMAEDLSGLLRRHFNESATNEVLKLVNDLFRRESSTLAAIEEAEDIAMVQVPGHAGRHRLH